MSRFRHIDEEGSARLMRLWPNRVHESNWLKAGLCRMGFHRWYAIASNGSLVPGTLQFCRWCSEVQEEEQESI